MISSERVCYLWNVAQQWTRAQIENGKDRSLYGTDSRAWSWTVKYIPPITKNSLDRQRKSWVLPDFTRYRNYIASSSNCTFMQDLDKSYRIGMTIYEECNISTNYLFFSYICWFSFQPTIILLYLSHLKLKLNYLGINWINLNMLNVKFRENNFDQIILFLSCNWEFFFSRRTY